MAKSTRIILISLSWRKNSTDLSVADLRVSPREKKVFVRLKMASIAGLYGGFGTNQEDGSGGRNLFSRFKKDIIKEQAEERRKQAEKDV